MFDEECQRLTNVKNTPPGAVCYLAGTLRSVIVEARFAEILCNGQQRAAQYLTSARHIHRVGKCDGAWVIPVELWIDRP